jgi:asparagine N-glycosylation enzyme membrane subunit Stt3
LKLWYESEEDRNNKTLVKVEAKESFRVIYNKHKANYNNKAFYTFHLTRSIKKKISQAAKNKRLDAYTL